MPSNNITQKTREMMGHLHAASLQLARGFESALEGTLDERRELFGQALESLQEMQHAIVNVAGLVGPGFTFEPLEHSYRICVKCLKPLSAHNGRDCKCPLGGL